MFKKLNQIWNFLDGKKTAIGAGLAIAGNAMDMIPGLEAHAKAVSYLGSAISVVGLAHKASK